ncbi:MAG: hypothetical protein EWV85_07005 [Microcystis aeruginosa Ma_QC_C_20070703_M131]|uniref:Uncharacterized protein n=1 Tax=Microcystis aeruginosa Ma_QC_C_20070703_M131 TaxID=2486263 RepID=A0A551Y8T9_MICAE|nr:MAG: hypothetical protein EWV85_07005 [Microcystis aeruginosa Ma_QC_C_20070703_M131]
MSIIFDLERTNQLSLLPDKDLVDLCPPIEPYQVPKSHNKQPRQFLLFTRGLRHKFFILSTV